MLNKSIYMLLLQQVFENSVLLWNQCIPHSVMFSISFCSPKIFIPPRTCLNFKGSLPIHNIGNLQTFIVETSFPPLFNIDWLIKQSLLINVIHMNNADEAWVRLLNKDD